MYWRYYSWACQKMPDVRESVMNLQGDQLIEAARKSDGVRPVCFLNLVAKCCEWLKPTASPISVTDCSRRHRSVFAFSIRLAMTYWCGVAPVLSEKARMKCLELNPVSSDISSRVIVPPRWAST